GINIVASGIGVIKVKGSFGNLADYSAILTDFVVGKPIVVMAGGPRDLNPLHSKICCGAFRYLSRCRRSDMIGARAGIVRQVEKYQFSGCDFFHADSLRHQLSASLLKA